MRDAELVDLGETGGADGSSGWRAGSLTLALAPLLIVAALVALVRAPSGPLASRDTPSAPAVATATLTHPTPFPLVAPTPLVTAPADVVETGDPEVLEDQRWTARGPRYVARVDVAEAVLNGRVYVIGGSSVGASEERSVYRFDPRTGARELVAALPIPLDHAMAAAVADRVLVFGGYSLGAISGRVFSYDGGDRWTEERSMPSGRAAGGAAVVNDRVYLVGGVGADGALTRETWEYDVHTKRWTTSLEPIPTPRDHLAVGRYGNVVCAAGGNGADRAFECYSPEVDGWKTMPSLRRPAVGARAAEAGGWFWVVSTDVQVFTFDHWHFGPRLLAWRTGHALAVIDDVIYVFEGATTFSSSSMEWLRVPSQR